MTNLKENFRVWASFYLPLIFWMGIIFYFSSIPGLSSGVSSVTTEIFLRKTAHFFEYFVLTFLVWRIFRFWKWSSLKSGLVSCLFCSLYAVSDEVHQHFVLDRAGRFVDVVIDSLAGISFYLVTILISRNKKRK